MNWGIRITILALGFVAFMTYLVVRASQQHFDLVTEDYYGKELKFGQQIEKQKNQQGLNDLFEMATSGDDIVISFPSAVSGKEVKGEILFFCPSDAARDLSKKIELVNGKQVLSRRLLSKGMYRVKIDYQVEGKGYYYEKTIMI